MKKLWEKYSYIIILAAVCFIAAFSISNKLQEPNEYINVTVNEGDSLWKIAEKYSDGHNMSSAEFVQWVEKKNGITGETIFPGEELTIPVHNDPELNTK